jgi:hypothetical protein
VSLAWKLLSEPTITPHLPLSAVSLHQDKYYHRAGLALEP